VDLEETALKIYEAMFADEESVEVDGEVYDIDLTSRAKVKRVRIDDLSFLEQNPKKDSHWAEEAREGRQIMWVMKGRKYLARVRDGRFLDLRKE
jgi:gamma-glutamylcyclotransferase (GGCT)/AIG2-like uncharacterized protein YtfP